MATKTKQSVEGELLEAAEIKGKGDDESAQKYLKRVVKACDDLDEKVWENLTQESQEWLADAVAAVNKKSDIPAFLGDDEDGEEDEDEEEEKPAKKKAKASKEDEDDEEEDEDDEEEEKPAKKKASKDDEKEEEEEDEDDEKPAKKKAAAKDEDEDEDEEEEEKPVKKAATPTEDPAKKKAAIAYTRRLVCRHPDWDADKVKKVAAKKGHELSDVLNKIIVGDTLATLKVLEDLGMLQDAPEE
jgi:hypothetical protein